MKLPTPREIAEKQQDPDNDCFIGVREDVARLRAQGARAAYAAVEKVLLDEAARVVWDMPEEKAFHARANQIIEIREAVRKAVGKK